MKKRREEKSFGLQMPTREKALEVLNELRQHYGDKAEHLCKENEATTRLLLIDRILGALGWSQDDFHPETPVKGDPGYIDYLLSVDERPQLIVEAKKRGTTFGHSQQGKLKKTEYELRYIRSAFGTISPVIDQATRYSHATGVPYSAITNGAEWFLMQSVSHGKQSIENLRCIYFGNLLSDVSDFNYFWELLAKPNVENGSLESYFSEVNSPFAEYCKVPRDQLGEPKWSPRSAADSHLREFYERFLDEITDSSRRLMLEHCFVTNATLDQYQGDLQRILRDTAPSYIPEAINITPEEGRGMLSEGSGDQKGRVILVTGSVGCGKSTLVTRVLVTAKTERKFENIIIDLIDEVEGDPDNFNLFLWNEVSKGWKEVYSDAYSDETLRKLFERELRSFRRSARGVALGNDKQQLALEEVELLEGLSKTPREFLAKSWRAFSKQTGKGIVVFLDNVDRASEVYQRLVYAFGHKLARETGATVIITMREVTYFRGRKHDFLDVRSSDKVYHLQTPNVGTILSRRLQYAEVQLELDQPLNNKQPDYRLRKWRSSADWENFRLAARSYIKILKTSLLASAHSHKLIGLLDSVAWHDVRYFLERLRSVHSMLGSDANEWSMSEVIAALMMPMQLIGHQFTLPNLFLPPHERYPCYFLRSRVLLMLLYGKRQSEILQGTNLRTILNFARKCGYQERWVRLAIEAMVRERLLECVEIPAAAEYTKNYDLEENHSFRASPLALTLLEYVQFDPMYLSLVGNEIPFHEDASYKEFLEHTQETIALLVDEGIDRSSMALLVETDANALVARYLIRAFNNEQPLGPSNFYPSEIVATETKLRIFIERLQELAPKALNGVVSTSAKASSLDQLSLDITLPVPPEVSRLDFEIPVPHKLKDGHSTRSEHLPKIFWALVKLRSQGQIVATGSEVTRIIKQYLADDLHKVEPTNISRALRGPTLQSQQWLVTSKVSERRKLYGLSETWPTFWQELFNEQPPILD